MSTGQAWGGRVSDWHDPLDLPMAEIAGRYGLRVPRSDVAAVEALRARLGSDRPRLTVVVVGSNGKTSTATYLSDLFVAAGLRTGLYTSPHIAYWGERVRVDDVPVDGDALVEAVRAVDAVAHGDERLRFFDVLTLAAERLFAAAEVDVAVYEAGIGGRTDATRCLRPDLVVLTTVALEHTQLLGTSEEEVLRQKLDVAPVEATVIAGALPEPLAAVARSHAREIGVRLDAGPEPALPPNGLPWYLGRNWHLASRAAGAALERLGAELPADAAPREVYGRFTDVRRDGVEYFVDVAHNPQAWDAFLTELRGRFDGERGVALVSVTRERPLDRFAEAVAASGLFAHVYATRASVRPMRDPEVVAAALRSAGQAVGSVDVARDAFDLARVEALAGAAKVAVFGSTFLVTDALSWLGEPPRFGTAASLTRSGSR